MKEIKEIKPEVSSIKHWKLNEKNEPVECSFKDWAHQGVVRIASDKIDNVHISTVFIGLGEYFTGRPYFETMIFGGPLDMYQERCSTYEQAQKQHAEALTAHEAAKTGRRIKEDL